MKSAALLGGAIWLASVTALPMFYATPERGWAGMQPPHDAAAFFGTGSAPKERSLSKRESWTGKHWPTRPFKGRPPCTCLGSCSTHHHIRVHNGSVSVTPTHHANTTTWSKWHFRGPVCLKCHCASSTNVTETHERNGTRPSGAPDSTPEKTIHTRPQPAKRDIKDFFCIKEHHWTTPKELTDRYVWKGKYNCRKCGTCPKTRDDTKPKWWGKFAGKLYSWGCRIFSKKCPKCDCVPPWEKHSK